MDTEDVIVESNAGAAPGKLRAVMWEQVRVIAWMTLRTLLLGLVSFGPIQPARSSNARSTKMR